MSDLGRSRETRGGFSLTRCRRASGKPNCISARRDLGLISRNFGKRSVTPASSEQCGHPCFRAIFLSSSILSAIAGYRCAARSGFRVYSPQDGRPVPVPVGIVESLIEQSDGKVTRLDTDLVKGQHVRILSGPFADFVGTLERLDEAGRVQVLLEMMGTAVPVTLHRSALSPAA